jgi:polyferredoxin
MERRAEVSDGLSPQRRRRLLQIIFVFVNLALVEAHLPGPLWLALGAIFWIALIGISIAGSNLVCGTMCWIGAIQDFFEPFARRRVRFDARWGRGLTLALLVIWMPVGWLVLPKLAAHDRMPLDASFGWEKHLFQFALAALVAGSVLFLGKRGICRYLCPFNSIVASARGLLSTIIPRSRASSIGSTPCSAACKGCTRSAGSAPVTAYERLKTS